MSHEGGKENISNELKDLQPRDWRIEIILYITPTGNERTASRGSSKRLILVISFLVHL